jgi:tetratricopeptide (TPR) repeat protein
MFSRVTLCITAALLALITPADAQTTWRDRCETPLFLQLRSGFDSNPLRLAAPRGGGQENGLTVSDLADPGGETGNVSDPSQADASALLRPSLRLRCAVTPKTTVGVTYTLGVERFMSTRLLNTTAQQAELRLQHRFSQAWTGDAYGSMERSNQPDILSTNATLNFANFTELRGGFRVIRRLARGSIFAEYFAQARRYSRLTTDLSAHQSDTLHGFTLGRWWTVTPTSFLSLRVDYRQNQSNDPLFRYREPIASVTYGRLLGNGFRFEATPRVRWLTFANRAVSNDPTRTRSDVIPGLTLALRKEFSPGVAGVVSYTFDKDFSTEPRRRFIDNRMFMGVDLTLGRSRRRLVPFAEDHDVHPLHAIELANLGYAEIKRGNWNEALRLSLEAIQLDPTLPEAHANAGIAYYKLGNQPAAIDEWKRSLALRPDEKVRSLLSKISGTP